MHKGTLQILIGQAPYAIRILFIGCIALLAVSLFSVIPFQAQIRACVMGCIHPDTFGQRHGAAGRVAVLLERYLP